MTKLATDYHAHTADWRGLLKRNQRRTRGVIAVFILLYVGLGLIIDGFYYTGEYPQASLSSIFEALVTFQLIPYATIITTAVALISLWITFALYDKLMLLGTEYHEITPETAKTLQEQQLYNTVDEMKVAAGLHYMPRVFIIEADYMNAFASGYSEKSAMIAITRGLLEKLDRAELQAVMAHELSHIRHLDIKLTLLAAVLANLMLIIIDFLFYGIVYGNRRSSRERGNGGNFLLVIIVILRYLLPLITVLLMLFLSRTREYMADAGAVELTRDNEPLARALLKIQGDYEQNQEEYNQTMPRNESIRREAYIFDPLTAGIKAKESPSDFFSTHPNMKKRLEALGFTEKE